jgi:predicted GNAT family acetyltransferase
VATTVKDNPEEHRFEIFVDDELAGFTVYRARPGIRAFIHTEIEPSHEGEGLGGQLVKAALDAAREANEEVLPFCPFVNDYISKHEEYLNLVPEDQRSRFGLT